jgi:hypothetical protein
MTSRGARTCFLKPEARESALRANESFANEGATR